MRTSKKKEPETCTYYVSGMHCRSCEILLEKKIQELEGIQKVTPSLQTSSISISYDKSKGKPKRDFLNALFKDSGYSFHPKPMQSISWDNQTITYAFLVFAVLGLIYLLFRNSIFLGGFTLNEKSTIPTFFTFGVIASISTCAALVGGLLLGLSKQWNQLYGGSSMARRALPFTMFNTGRLISYAFLGGLMGAIGGYFQISLGATSFLVIAVSIITIILGLQMLNVPWISGIKIQLPSSITKKVSNENTFKGKYMPFFTGAFTFFIPCGFTLLAQTLALTSGSFLKGSLMMFAFALGTLPVLIGISFSSIKFQSNPTFSKTFNLTAGILIILFGLYNISSQMTVLGVYDVRTTSLFNSGDTNNNGSSENGIGVQKSDNKDVQKVILKAEGFEYFPKNLSLEANVPTDITILSSNVLGCAQAMYMRGLYDEVIYLNKPETTISIIPKKGNYLISCTMGMVQPIKVIVN